MEGIAPAMRELVAQLSLRPGNAAVVSAITGAPLGDDAREIWIRHATAPVDFISALRSAAGLGARVFVQVGAGSVLSSFVKATPWARALSLKKASRFSKKWE